MSENMYFGGLTKTDKIQLYISNMKPALNADALFADGTERYRSYKKRGDGNSWDVCLRFRTAKDNAESVTLVTDELSLPMEKIASDRFFDYYEVCTSYPGCGHYYHFEVRSGKSYAVYNKRGALDAPQNYYDFIIRPHLSAPDWAKGAVFYQIFVDRFCNGDKSNDVLDGEYIYLGQKVWTEKDWDACPGEMDVCHFYGGDLKGVLDKLDYLQDLGVEVIYLNPVFVSPSNHKYDIQDYDYVDPHFTRIARDEGAVLTAEDQDNSKAERYINRVSLHENLEESNRFFADFIAQVHSRGMKVILDGVFNHCGSFNKWMDRENIYSEEEGYPPGAFESYKSPYRKFFRFKSWKWPRNNNYEGWWGFETLPKLNYEASESLYKYIMDIAKKWVSPPYCADGWRLDVAEDVGYSKGFNHRFWRDFRKAVKKANPDALILAEHYNDPADWLDGRQWDSVMNYQAFMEPVTWFLTGMEKHSDSYREDLLGNYEAFETAMLHNMSRMNQDAIFTAMNELSNHDHSRFLTRTNGKVGRLGVCSSEDAEKGVNRAVMREAVLIQMSWPGAPTVYYGDEAGLCGWTDPDNRRSFPWGHEDLQMLSFHREAIKIHRESSALRKGSLKMLCGGYSYMAFGRFDDEQRYVTIINNRHESMQISVPVILIGIGQGDRMERLIFSTEHSFSAERRVYSVKDGSLMIDMPATSGMILRSIS